MLNKLSLNVRKTNYILFTSNRQKIDTGNLVIQIDDIIIENVEKTKFLGVIINSKLNWNYHIQTISNKISKNVGIIFRTRNNLNCNTLMLYHSMIQPYLDYCNIVWAVGGLYLELLFKMQIQAIRAITFAKWNAHSDSIFEQLKILKLKQINIFQTCSFDYKSLHNLLPSQFRNFFTINNEIHHYNTRSACKIHQFNIVLM